MKIMKKIIYLTFLLMFLISSVFSQKTSISQPPVSSDNKIVITQNISTICNGTKIVFTANYTQPLIRYQWSYNFVKIVGATKSTYMCIPKNGDILNCTAYVQSDSTLRTMASSGDYKIDVSDKVPVSIGISVPSSVSQGTTITATANPINGGTTPIYQWKLNGVNVGTNSNTYIFTPAVSCTLTCTLTSNLGCVTNKTATSSIFNINVTPAPSISIATQQNPFCFGYPATFTATPLNAGTTPTFQWKVNGAIVNGATSSTYTYTPNVNNTVICVLNGSINSNTITMIKATSYWYSSIIKSTAVKVLPSTSVTFTAIPSNGGSSPRFQWVVNNTNVLGATTSTYTYVPLNGDNVKCNVYSSLVGCVNGQASSNTITMSVTTVTNECPGLPTVTYEGKVYPTVLIGTQCWLAKDLNVGIRINGNVNQSKNTKIEKYCMNDLESNCDIYGGLYNWGESVNYLNNANNTTNWNPVPTGPVQGICPPGWHIPTLNEWNTLVNYLGGQGVAGGKLKENSYNHWGNPNYGASNESNFTGLGSGYRWTDGLYHYFGVYVSYWTVTAGANPNTDVYYGGMGYGIEKSNSGQFYKNNSNSIRCLKD